MSIRPNTSHSKFYILLVVALCQSILSFGANPPVKVTRQEYIQIYSKIAIREMIDFHIPASITMAQACLESGNGNSTLATEANNHFGIKCKGNWNGPSVRKTDDAPNECFRKYNNALESYRDHSQFLTGGTRYQFLFDYNIKDYKNWAYGLKKAGYATDPSYPERLLKIIDEFELYKLDDKNGFKTKEKRSFWKSLFGKSPSKVADEALLVRRIERRNGAKAFFARQGDTYDQIADEFGMNPSTLYRYNDVPPGTDLEAGTVVFLTKKRSKAPRGNDVYTLKAGDSMWTIAQWYGIRLDALYHKNRLTRADTLVVGQQISLRLPVAK